MLVLMRTLDFNSVLKSACSLTHQHVARGRTIHSHTEEMDIEIFLRSSSLLMSLLTNSCR